MDYTLRPVKIGWLFPGQGSQVVGMGKAISEASAAARAVFERADAALGEPLSTLCFEGPLETLTLTANTQPALVATSLALVAAIREQLRGAAGPAIAAGHSLGEYSALAAAGALTIEDAVKVCRKRGMAMQEAVPAGEGAMAAVMGLDADAVIALCKDAAQGEVLGPANWNSPGQTVISGHARAVERACALAGERKGKAVPLAVSAPFHSALMEPAAVRVALALDRVTVHQLAFPVIANYHAEANKSPAPVRELLYKQVEAPVQWQKTIELMAAEGVTHALEIGPGKVLAGLVKRITKAFRVHNVSDPAGLAGVQAFLETKEA